MTREVTHKNIKYGMLVEVLHDDGSYHAGCKVHFFNKKGVLVGNYYKFLPYERLRLRETMWNRWRQYPRYFYPKRFEGIRMFFFKILLRMTGCLLRITQKKMD